MDLLGFWIHPSNSMSRKKKSLIFYSCLAAELLVEAEHSLDKLVKLGMVTILLWGRPESCFVL